MALKIHARLGAADLAATTNTSIYTVPAGRKATVKMTAVNRSASDVTLRVMHCPGAIGSVVNADYIEYGVTLAANGGRWTEDREPMAAAASIGAWASATGVSFQVKGIEEDAL